MIYIDKTEEEWREKWKLDIRTYDCPKCNKQFKTTVPIIMGDCAGFESPIHECGSQYTKVTLTPATDKAKEFWNSVV